jgi:hypothetical protein
MSARLAAKVTGITSGGPPVLGSPVAVALGLAVAVAVAVGLAVAVAVAVGLAVIPPRCCFAKAAEESRSTSTAHAVKRSKSLFL